MMILFNIDFVLQKSTRADKHHRSDLLLTQKQLRLIIVKIDVKLWP